jgi:ketosteroid isomerase-like protein
MCPFCVRAKGLKSRLLRRPTNDNAAAFTRKRQRDRVSDNAGMPQETIEIAHRGLDQFNQDFASPELNLDLLAPDVVIDNSNAALDAAVYRGHEGMRELMSVLRGMWKLQQGEAQEFITVDEDRVIVPIRLVSVGREDVEVVARAAMLVTVGDGKITHMKSFQSKADALEAVGLSAQDDP